MAGDAARGDVQAAAAASAAPYAPPRPPWPGLAAAVTTPADRVIADAVAAVIAARITAALAAVDLPELIITALKDREQPLTVPEAAAAVLARLVMPPGLIDDLAAAESRQAVRDLRRDGWHITALPLPVPLPVRPEDHA